MALEKTSYSALGVYLGDGLKAPLHEPVERDGLYTHTGSVTWKKDATVEVGVGCLEEDLDSVQRSYDSLPLSKCVVEKQKRRTYYAACGTACDTGASDVI